MLTRLGLRQSHGRYSGEAFEEAIHSAKDRRWRNEKDDPFAVHCIVLWSTDDGLRLPAYEVSREGSDIVKCLVCRMYGQRDQTSLTVEVLIEGSHVAQWHCL